MLQTDDGAAIGMTYRGMRHGPAAVMDRMNRGEHVDPSEYYFRTSVAFETAAPNYDWLNRIDRRRHRTPPARRAGVRRVRGAVAMATIGFIGLGNMGAPMAANLVKAGHRVTGYDLNAAALPALATAGGEAAASAADAARGAEIVITMLPAGEHVREVWLHQGGLIEAVKAAPSPLLIDCSTIDVASARAVEAARAAPGWRCWMRRCPAARSARRTPR